MTLRVALVGCGRWGQKLGAALARLSDVVLAGFVDRDARALATAAAHAPGAPRFASVRQLVAAGPTLDAALVATPSAYHATHGLALLRAGLDVLVEKPFATSRADARMLAAEARRLGRIGMAGHVLRYHPAFEALIALGRGGALGRLVRWQGRRFTRSGSASPLWTLAPHDLAALHALDGSPLRHVAVERLRAGASEHFELYLELGSGLSASFEVSTDAATPERRVRVEGSHGVACVDELAPEAPLTVSGAHDGGAVAIAVERGEPLLRELAHFVMCVRMRTEPRTSFEEALWTVETLERAERALAASAPASALSVG